MNLTEPLRCAVIIGSTRKGRIGPTVARWFTEQARRHGEIEIDTVDLAEHPDPLTLAPRLRAAEAFVVVTPEYNHSFPGPLKHAVDAHYGEWHAKPVGFVGYGGISGGLRAIEQLRLVFAELHAVGVRDTVSFHEVHQRFDAEGDLSEPAAAEGAAKRLLDQLVWWGVGLRRIKADQPYGA